MHDILLAYFLRKKESRKLSKEIVFAKQEVIPISRRYCLLNKYKIKNYIYVFSSLLSNSSYGSVCIESSTYKSKHPIKGS